MMPRWIIPLLLLGHQSCCVPTTLPPEDDTSNPPDSSASSSSTSMDKKPNIFLIVADDLGWNDVPWHNSDIVAPNILDLANDGIILNRSYVQPICTPSRSALLTGRYPFTIGRQSGVLRPMEPTGLTMKASPLLPEVMKDLGYSTHAVGKWHLGFCNWKYTPTERGFDTFYGYYNGAEGYFSHWRSDLHEYDQNYALNVTNIKDICEPAVANLSDKHEVKGGYDFRRNKEPDFSPNGTYSTHAFASYVENLLDSRDPDDPFFLYMPFQSVHGPLEVPENYTEPYKNIQCKSRRTYCGMVTAMDEAIGRMVAALKRTDHYNNTIIIFTTDNGGPVTRGANNWPLRGSKTTYWEGGTRGSAFLHSPLLTHKKYTSNKLVHLVDWYTTLTALAGGKVKDQRDGFDVWKALTSPDASVPSPRTHMVYNIDQTHEFRAAIRIGDYKLIVGNPGEGDWTPPPKLYREDTDISENMTKLEDQGEESEEYGNEKEDGDLREDTIEYEMNVEMREDEYENLGNSIKELSIDVYMNIVEDNSIKEDTNEIPSQSIENQAVKKEKKYLREEKMEKETKWHDRVIAAKNKLHFSPVILNIERPTLNTDDFINNLKGMTNEEPLVISKNEKFEERTMSTLPAEDIGNFEEEGNALADIMPKENGTYGNVTKQIDSETAFPTLEEFLDSLKKNKTKIQLYNVQDDPEERVDLSQKLNKTVSMILVYLHKELGRYVPADIKKPDEKGNPKYWKYIWTPGWC